MSIEFKEGAVCFANEKQWFITDDIELGDVVSEARSYLSFDGVVNPFDNDFQINTIKQGYYIPKSELDTEDKYNRAVEAFGLFGFEFNQLAAEGYRDFYHHESLTCCADGLWQTSTDRWNERKITYQQLIAIGELKRLEIEREKLTVCGKPKHEFVEAINRVNELESEDVVNKPSHYQFFEGVEVIEIIASSMTREQFKGYCLDNRIKYRLRAGNKDELEQEIAKSDKYVELYDEHKHLCRIDGDLK